MKLFYDKIYFPIYPLYREIKDGKPLETDERMLSSEKGPKKVQRKQTPEAQKMREMGFGNAFKDEELEASLIQKYGENKFRLELKEHAKKEAEEEVK